jgi:hypothetical protein
VTTHEPIHEPTTSYHRRRLALVALGALALVAAACGEAAGESGDGALAVAIAAPGDGAAVGPSVEVEVDAGVELGEPDTGRHHLHLYVDGNTTEGEYLVVYDDGAHTITDLAPGEHRIEARIANADHSLTDAGDEITVVVGEDTGDAADPTSPTEDAPVAGY